MGLKSDFGPEEEADGTVGASRDSSGAYPRPVHEGDEPFPGHGGMAPTEPETEDDVKKKAFLFAAWLDDMTPDAIKKLWRKLKAEESSS